MALGDYKLYGSWSKTFRYYNDMGWFYLNMISMVSQCEI